MGTPPDIATADLRIELDLMTKDRDLLKETLEKEKAEREAVEKQVRTLRQRGDDAWKEYGRIANRRSDEMRAMMTQEASADLAQLEAAANDLGPALQRAEAAEKKLEEFISRVESDRREPDKLLCHDEDREQAVEVLTRFMCCKAGEQYVEEKLLRPFGFTLDAGPVVRENNRLREDAHYVEVLLREMVENLDEGDDDLDRFRRRIFGTAQYLKSKLAEHPSSWEPLREKLNGEIAHLRELGAGERREVDRAVSGSSDERVFHARATVYEYIAKRLAALTKAPADPAAVKAELDEFKAGEHQ